MTDWERLRELFLGCPLLPPSAPLGLGRLDSRPGSFALLNGGTPRVLRRYLDGSARLAVPFRFCSREYLSGDTRDLLRIHRFYQALEQWAAQFPELRPDSSPEPSEISGKTVMWSARYEFFTVSERLMK